MMVVVVPAFAHGHDRQEPIIAAAIIRFISPRADEMSQRIDHERRMVEQNRSNHEAQCNSSPTSATAQQTSDAANDTQQDSGNPMPVIEPHQFGKLDPIFEHVPSRRIIGVFENPANVRIPNRLGNW